MNMTKDELIRQVATNLNIEAKLVKKIILEFLNCITESIIAKNTLELRNLLTIKFKIDKERLVRNWKTGQQEKIKPRLKIICKVSSKLSNILNKNIKDDIKITSF